MSLGFVAGTLVHTDKGLLPIQNLQVGDYVLSRSINENETQFKKILRVLDSSKTVIYRIIHIDNQENYIQGEKIKAKALFAAENHQFWIEEIKCWKSVQDFVEYETVISSLKTNKGNTVVSTYPVFAIEVNECDVISSKNIMQIEKIGHCTQENLRPDIDAILFSNINGVQIHKYENWNELFDVDYDLKVINIEMVESLENLDINTSPNFFNTEIYNIEVEDCHNYFVGHDGILVGDSTIQGNDK